ncbi:uroporphyrinogen decarboxylase [Caulobacter sp. S45]|uniref:uroporphyrinogen decarboxylase n=1 Tax=Caulobacter sp. S45 TaxID=1641861 RepID=UPI0020C6E194|nr:uroporphyrinogen decarboxylase [Caulobacter sp. S45]
MTATVLDASTLSVRTAAPVMIRVLNGERVDPPPVWIMRQAGRYLPEYRQLRTKAKDFLSFCYTPDLAVEAVLQPLRRFDLDAAILFSDILVVPDALGRKVWFVEGTGPRLEPLAGLEHWRFGDVDRVVPFLAPVYETVRRLRAEAPSDKALIGFAGAPWTVATYMIQGKGGDKDLARRTAYERPADVDALLAVLVEATARHLQAQVEAGADCLQLFESWAEGLSEPLFERMILSPTKALMARLRALGVGVPVVGFPRGSGALIGRYARETGVTALGVDTQTPAAFARAEAPVGMALQGALDPMLLVCGGAALEAGARQVIEAFRGSPHIFNLGHGITPEAKPEHLATLVDLIKRG